MYALTFPSQWVYPQGLMNYSACKAHCYCVEGVKMPYSNQLAWCLVCPQAYLLLHAGEQGGIVTLFGH